MTPALLAAFWVTVVRTGTPPPPDARPEDCATWRCSRDACECVEWRPLTPPPRRGK